ncbi:MAG: ABC transporter permease subunit [Anaerolineae bacterium]|nr:ABC transporter permease subunit [Anaerolineae bacterium]
MWKARMLYVLLLPAILFFLIFRYYPYWGLSLAFKDFKPAASLFDMPWVGFAHFERLFSLPAFSEVVVNTLVISLLKLIIGMPVPIIFALLLNEIRFTLFKRGVQTVTLFPHFLSWVVYGGIMVLFLAPGGLVADLVQGFGINGNTLLVDTRYFRGILVVTDIMKGFGFSAILYLAAMTSIDTELYDAARVDGANRLHQIRYITLPGIAGVIVIVLILNLGHILDAGFEQVFVMYNPAVYSVADIIDTYTYRIGLVEGKFSVATALGLFKGIIGFILIVSSNQFIKRSGQATLW